MMEIAGLLKVAKKGWQGCRGSLVDTVAACLKPFFRANPLILQVLGALAADGQ